MKEQRQEYTEYLDKDEIRHIVDFLHMVVEDLRPVHRSRICVHMHKKEQTERNYTRQLVQFSEQKCFAESDSHCSRHANVLINKEMIPEILEPNTKIGNIDRLVSIITQNFL